MRLFRISDLGGNCSQVIGKYASYTYPFLPVGVRWHDFRGHSLSRRTGLWRLTPESSSLRAFQRLSVRRRMRAAKGTLIPSPAECVSRWRVEVPEKTARSRNESNQSVPDWEGDGWSWWDRIIAAQVSPKEGRTRAPGSAARHLPWYSTNSSG